MVGSGRNRFTHSQRQIGTLLTKRKCPMKDDDKKKQTRAAEIIRMLAAKRRQEDEEDEMDANFQIWLEEQEHKRLLEEKEKNQFHNFEKMGICMNSMGLYRSIMEEIEFENDPRVLKAFFSERLGQILEEVPDKIASTMLFKINGLL